MVTNFFRQRSLACLFLLCMTCHLAQANPSEMTLDGFKLGQGLEDVRPQGNFHPTSRLIPGAQSVVTDNSSVHLIDGTVRIIGGSDLRVGSRTVLSEGQTQAQVFSIANELGWNPVDEWDSSADVAGYNYSILKLRSPDNFYIIVSLFKVPGGLRKVSEIYIRDATVSGPYGDSNSNDKG